MRGAAAAGRRRSFVAARKAIDSLRCGSRLTEPAKADNCKASRLIFVDWIDFN